MILYLVEFIKYILFTYLIEQQIILFISIDIMPHDGQTGRTIG